MLERFNNEARRVFTIIEKQLSENDFFASDYSIADIATYPWIKEYERYGINSDQVPGICAWLERLAERKAIQRGFEPVARIDDYQIEKRIALK